MPCDNFFENLGIPYDPDYADAAVRAAKIAPGLSREEKKWLVSCWYDTTFGSFERLNFNRGSAADEMAKFLRGTPYTTFEDLLEDTTNAPYADT